MLTAGILGMYFYGLFLGIYGPLELGALSFICLGLLVLFSIHEILLRRELREHPRDASRGDKERRGF